MILLHKERKIVITPTKTGTNSLKSIASAQHAALSLTDPSLANSKCIISPKHRTVIPTPYIDYQPVLIVRNPWDRIASMYKFIKPRPGQIENLGQCFLCSQTHFGSGHTDSFVKFIDHFNYRFVHQPDPIWSYNLSTIMEIISAQTKRPIQIREAGDFMDDMGWARRNVNQSKDVDEELWNSTTYELIRYWCEPDCDKFGYHPYPSGFSLI